MLLEDDRPLFGQTFGQPIAKLLARAVQLRLGAPTHARGLHEHLLGTHPQNHVRVGAHPDTSLPNLAKQRIELRAVETVLNRVHPDQHSIEPEQLIANGIHGLIEQTTGAASTPSAAKARNISCNLHDSVTETCASGASHSTRHRRPTLTIRVYEPPKDANGFFAIDVEFSPKSRWDVRRASG